MTLLPKFREQIHGAASRRARRHRRLSPPAPRLRATATGLPAIASILVAIAVAVIALTALRHGHAATPVNTAGPAGSSNPLMPATPGGVAGSEPRVLSLASHPAGHSIEDQAIALVNLARQQAQASSPACGQQINPTPHTSISEGRPPASLLSMLGVLRRQPTTAELAVSLPTGAQEPGLLGPPGAYTYYRRYVRLVDWPHGVTMRITVGHGHWSVPRDGQYPCIDAATKVLRRIVVGQPAKVANEALRLQLGYKLGPQAERNNLLLGFQGLGGTAGIFNATAFRSHGIQLEGGSLTSPRGSVAHYEWDIDGLVPDGVTSVTVKLFGRSDHLGALGGPNAAGDEGFAHPFEATVRVRENTFLVYTPADPNSAAHQQVIFNRG